jgi:hypothetical protein
MSTERTYWFGGGLGDVIISIYWYTAYEELLTEEDAWVVYAFGNPHCAELFWWLPNRKGLRLVDGNGPRMHYMEQGVKGTTAPQILEWAGRDPAGLYYGERRAVPYHWQYDWQAPDKLVIDEPYVVIQPFAGDHSRDIPVPVLRRLAHDLLGRGITPVFVTRNFVRVFKGHLRHTLEVLPADLARFKTPEISVPATLALTQKARGVVGMHSALTHAGACMGRKTLAVQNAAVLQHRSKDGNPCAGSWYFYYEAYPHVTRLPLEQGWEKILAGWVADL